MQGPRTVFADNLHQMKYRQPGEDFREAVNRWSFALKDDDAHYHVLRDVFGDMRFLPPGRAQSAIGALGRETTGYNCFVSRKIMDSFVHGEGSIMDAVKEAATTMRMGGGVGHDFSTLRPRGDAIRKLQSTSSGPTSFMRIFNEVGLATASSGHRRGAQMAVMRVDHPDINEFVTAKQPTTAQRALWKVVEELAPDHPLRPGAEAALQETLPLQGFNISVGVTDEFMEAVYAGREFELRFGDVGYRTVDAAELWEKIMRSTWDWSEPGVLFLDRINEMNNLWYCETIAATNPCVVGETLIEVAGEGPVSIAKLAKRGKDVPVFAVDPKSGETIVRMGRSPRLTGRKMRIVRVTLDDGSSLRVTNNHKFPLRDGRKVQAKDLKAGDSLFRFDAAMTKQDGMAVGLGNARRLEYHLIAEAKYGRRFKFGRRKGELNVHHLNEDHFDNDWDNIEVEETGSHSALHRIGDKNPMRFWWKSLSEKERTAYRARMSASTSGERNGMSGRRHSPETLAKIGTKTVKRFKDPAHRALHSNAVKAAMAKMTPENRARNHKVVSVEEDGTADVYNITVDEFHNYAVSTSEGRSVKGNERRSGVFVCNCGEQPLPPFGACLLGSFNLVRYLKQGPLLRIVDHLTVGNEVKYSPGYVFDLDRLAADIAPVIRAMDNVVDRTRYPLALQRGEATSKRRMGIGVTGLANAGEALGFPYGTPEFVDFTRRVLTVIRDESYHASALLAKEKGSFPLYDEEKYLQGRFVKTLPDDVRDLIKKYGIRNSHLTSIAPTGTISMAADNVSSGLEPVIYHAAERKINTPTGSTEVVVEDYGTAFLGVRGRLSEEVSPREHVDVLCAASLLVDSAVSKTCNVDGTVPWADFKALYEMGHRGGAKGLTTYNKDGSRGSIMKAAQPRIAEGDSCEVGPDGRRNCA